MTDSIIDIHAHFYPRRYLELIAEEGAPFGASCALCAPDGPVVKVGTLIAGPLGGKFIDLDARIAAMDEQGVAVQALSLTQPMVYWAGEALAQRLTEAFNDALIAAHEAHPQRIVGFAILPMHAPGLAIKELDRLAGAPGIKGAYIATRVLDKELSDPAFFPVYERLEALGLPVFLHPLEVIGMERLAADYFLQNLLGNPFDTAVAAAHLIFGGVLDRFSKLEICLPHAGGALPYLIGRLQHGWSVRPELKHMERGPRDYLGRFHYDTISHDPKALAFLIDEVGADRVMMGSDYCFDMGYERPVEVVTMHPSLTENDKAAILEGNARRLLGL